MNDESIGCSVDRGPIDSRWEVCESVGRQQNSTGLIMPKINGPPPDLEQSPILPALKRSKISNLRMIFAAIVANGDPLHCYNQRPALGLF